MSIGKNVKKIREERNLTQQKLAKEMNISRSYLSDIENNRKNPSFKTLEALAEKLNVSMLCLTTGDTTESSTECKVCGYQTKDLNAFEKEDRRGETQPILSIEVHNLNQPPIIKYEGRVIESKTEVSFFYRTANHVDGGKHEFDIYFIDLENMEIKKVSRERFL